MARAPYQPPVRPAAIGRDSSEGDDAPLKSVCPVGAGVTDDGAGTGSWLDDYLGAQTKGRAISSCAAASHSCPNPSSSQWGGPLDVWRITAIVRRILSQVNSSRSPRLSIRSAFIAASSSA